jgi:hypothetical protein
VVQNLAKEGYMDADVDIPLKAVKGYREPIVTFEKFKAIQLGKTALKDIVERLSLFKLKFKRLYYFCTSTRFQDSKHHN